MHQYRKAGEQLEKIPSEGCVYNLKVGTWESGGVYEVWEMIFDEGKEVPYHEHHTANETFIIQEGSIEVTLAGNKFIANAGDTVHAPAYMPHSMVFLEKTTFYSVFNGYKFYHAMKERNILKANNPAAFKDEAFMDAFRARIDSHSVATPEQVTEEPNDYQCRKAGQELAKLPSGLITYNLKVAAWETGNEYEVWEMIMEKGMEIPYHEHHSINETFILTEGSAEITMAGNTFVATAGDTIHTPAYLPHGMLMLEDTTWIAVFNNYDYYNIIKERTDLAEHNPVAWENEAFQKAYRARIDSHFVTSPAQVLEESKATE